MERKGGRTDTDIKKVVGSCLLGKLGTRHVAVSGVETSCDTVKTRKRPSGKLRKRILDFATTMGCQSRNIREIPREGREEKNAEERLGMLFFLEKAKKLPERRRRISSIKRGEKARVEDRLAKTPSIVRKANAEMLRTQNEQKGRL